MGKQISVDVATSIQQNRPRNITKGGNSDGKATRQN